MGITAVDVLNAAADSAQSVPMLEESEETTGARVPITLADGGYHTAANVEAGELRGDVFVMPERYHRGVQDPSSVSTMPDYRWNATRPSGISASDLQFSKWPERERGRKGLGEHRNGVGQPESWLAYFLKGHLQKTREYQLLN